MSRTRRAPSWRSRAGRALVLCGLWVLPAQAELRVLEVVGAVPVSDSGSRFKMPKEQAIDEALLEGVSRVAEEFLIEADPALPPVPDQRDRLRSALGPDMVPYTRSFRIVEDQGERPVLFTEHPDAATEYVVVVSVEVETERIREQLIRSGLLVDEGQGVVRGYELHVKGLSHYRGYLALIELLESESVGVKMVTPRAMGSEGLTVLVEADFDPATLLERLRAAAPSNLEIRGDDSPEERPGQAADEVGVVSGVAPLSDMSSVVESPRKEIVRIEMVWRPLAQERGSPEASGARR